MSDVDPLRLIAFARAINAANEADVADLDPVGVDAMGKALRSLRDEIDAALARLSWRDTSEPTN